MTYHAPTETNPPFTSPPTWPFPTTSTEWEPDYRLRLLEAAIIWMWTQGIPGSPVGPAGGDLGGTYPNPTVPGLHLPAPVGTGAPFTTYTDSYGKTWIAQGGVSGGAWKDPRDVLYCSYAQTSAFAVSTSWGNMVWDTKISDNYNMESAATFTIPLSGLWQINYCLHMQATTAGQWLQLGIPASRIVVIGESGGAVQFSSQINVLLYYTAGQTLLSQGLASTVLNGAGGAPSNFFQLKYAGTG